MPTRNSFLIPFVLYSLATGCAHEYKQILPSSSPTNVDPLADIVPIPPGACLGLDDHFAISTNGVRALLLADRKRTADFSSVLAKCDEARQISEIRRASAEKSLSDGDFWRRWGVLIGGVLGFIGGAVVPVTLLLLENKR